MYLLSKLLTSNNYFITSYHGTAHAQYRAAYCTHCLNTKYIFLFLTPALHCKTCDWTPIKNKGRIFYYLLITGPYPGFHFNRSTNLLSPLLVLLLPLYFFPFPHSPPPPIPCSSFPSLPSPSLLPFCRSLFPVPLPFPRPHPQSSSGSGAVSFPSGSRRSPAAKRFLVHF